MGGHPSGWSLNYKKRIMPVSVDTVYQRVLALANKEQRGYITPQEYDLLANQAQMQIFESYFYSKNLRGRVEPLVDNDVDESNIDELLNRKLNPFSTIAAVTGGNTFLTSSGGNDVFQVGSVFLDGQVCEKVSINQAQRFTRSVRHIATTSSQGPVYCDSTNDGADIDVFAGSATPITTGVTAEYFTVPATVHWPYVVVNGQAMYNSSDATLQNYTLHRSEEDTLVIKILELAGIVINKPGLVQIAAAKDSGETQVQSK